MKQQKKKKQKRENPGRRVSQGKAQRNVILNCDLIFTTNFSLTSFLFFILGDFSIGIIKWNKKMENDFSCKALRLYDCFMNIRFDIINENARNKVNTDTVYNFGLFLIFLDVVVVVALQGS